MTAAGRVAAGAGGTLLVVSLFLPWAEVGGDQRSGWELWTMADVYLLVAALAGLAAAVTGGRIGVFRPDMSVGAMADLLNVVGAVLLVWLLAFDFPAGAGREAGAWVALAATAAIFSGAGDYAVLRGAPAFPRLGS